jgi:tetratricopeptide (TPR) repeat protein
LYAQEESYLKQAQTLATSLDDKGGLAGVLLHLGKVATHWGDYEQTEAYLQEGLDLARQLKDSERLAALLQSLGALAGSRGDYEQAEVYLQEGLDLARQLRHREYITGLLVNLGALASDLGNDEQAEVYLQEGVDLARQLGFRLLIAAILDSRGELHLKRSELGTASKDFHEALEVVLQESQDLRADALFGLARIEEALGNYTEARRQGEISLKTFEKIDHKKAPGVGKWLSTLPLSW